MSRSRQGRGPAPGQGAGPQQPHGNGGAANTGTSNVSVRDPADVAVQLRRVLATDRPTYETGWVDGYRRGFAAGFDVGHGSAHRSRDEQWNAIAKKSQWYAQQPSHAKLAMIRDTPGGEAYLAAQARRGGTEYTGGPVDWDTGRPLRVIQGGRRG